MRSFTKQRLNNKLDISAKRFFNIQVVRHFGEKRSPSRAKASIFNAVDWKILKLKCPSYCLNVAKSLFLLLGFVLLIAAKSDDVNKHTQHPLVGTSYSFIFEDLDGNEVNLDEMYDKTIFLNFWASWCKPCLKEMPSIKQAQQQLKDTNYEFVLVSDDNPMNIVNFQRKYKYPFMHLYSPVSKTELGVDILPHTYIIKNGMILAVYEGTYDWSAKTYIDQLRDMAH